MSAQTVKVIVANHYGIELDAMIANRSAIANAARVMAMYVMRHVLAMSYPKIAVVFEQHHTSIMTSTKRLHARIEAGHGVRSDYERIVKALAAVGPDTCPHCLRPLETELDELRRELSSLQLRIDAATAARAA